MGRNAKSNNEKKSYQNRTRGTKTRNTVQNGKTHKDNYSKGAPLSQENAQGANDVAWYSKNPEMLRSVGNISFLAAQGSKWDWYNGKELSIDNYVQTNPGIMRLEFVPTFGKSESKADAVNIAAQNIYTYIRNTNSGARNYAAADLMMYLLALDSIYMMWNHARTVYGMARSFSAINRYMGEALIRSMNYDYDDIAGNLASYRTQINNIAAKITTLCAPATMPLFLRHSWMTSNVFADEPNGKASFYYFIPTMMYIFSEKTSDQGTQLLPLTKPDTFGDVLKAINVCIDRLLYSDSAGILSGDILKAYGATGLFRLSPISEDFEVVPSYNPTVLTQIENIITAPVDPESLTISQDVNTQSITQSVTLKEDPALTTYFGYVKPTINLHVLEPTPGDIMEATRLMVTNEAPGSKVLYTYGTEIVTDITIIGIDYDSDGTGLNLFARDGFTTYNHEQFFSASEFGLRDKFNYAPRLYLFYVTEDENGGDIEAMSAVIGDVDVIAFVERNQLANIHDVALFSLMDIPSTQNF